MPQYDAFVMLRRDRLELWLSSGNARAPPATALRLEKRFLERCNAFRNSMVFPELAQPGFRPGGIGPPPQR
jgi:hypothetical protein